VAIVYVVDDDASVRDSLAWLLDSLAADVRAYGSADDFLCAYDPSVRGCLVLDICMPGTSGLELQRMLSARGVHLPIVAISGDADRATVRRMLQAGARAFFEKPFDGCALIDCVERCLAEA
jgi:FixJ family two-component response regulator